eukprot:COSAG02_NODE_76599_length_133_cov_90.117647_1_plen_25_part_01
MPHSGHGTTGAAVANYDTFLLPIVI